MASPSDPLLALRQAVKLPSSIKYTKGSEPTEMLASATHIVLGSPSLSLARSVPTRLRKPGASATDPAASPGDFFTLDAVFLAWLLRDASTAEYMREARENGLNIGFVSVTDRKAVVDWLEGRVADLASIVPIAGESTTPPGSPPPRASTSLPAVPASGSQTSPAKKRPYVVDSADSLVVKKIKLSEIELRDRTTVLRGVKPNNFSAIRAVYAETLKKMREPSKPGAVASASAPDAKMLARKARNMQPIIIISSSPTALITMHNVKRFLQEATFEPSQDARARATAEGNTKPEDMIPVYRKRTIIDPSGRETELKQTYYVVDSVEALSKFGSDAWDRVVCVMTTGQAWQFKVYKWNEPKALFHHVKGVYVCWSNDPANPKIKDWNVTPLKIEPNRRHVDKSIVAEFWKVLDAWTLSNKPWLMK